MLGSGMTYHLVSFGCQMNLSDTERIATVLDSAGFVRTGREEDADLIGAIACSVRQRAIDRVDARIERWNAWKAQRPLLTFVSGCVLPHDEPRLAGKFDFLVRTADVPSLPDLIRQDGVVTPALRRSLRLRRRIPGHRRCLLEDHPALLLRLRRVRAHPERLRQALHLLRGPLHPWT